jgi:hypothetical protein
MSELAGTGKAKAREEGNRIETAFLQLVMTRLWDEEFKANSRRLRLSTFDRLGGAGKIVQGHLDDVMKDLPSKEQETSARMFQYLVTPRGNKIAYETPDLVAFGKRSKDEVIRLLETLSRKRVLRRTSPPERYEIFHDVLAPAILDWRATYVNAQEILEGTAKRVNTQLGVGLYLVFLFFLVWPLIKLWPPAPSDRSKLLDRARAATDAAESAAKLKALAARAALEKATRSGEAAKSAPQGSPARVQADRDEAELDQAYKEKAQADTELEQRLRAEKDEADMVSGGGEDLVTVSGKITRDLDLILLVLLAGALGAWIHVGWSYVDFVGNRALKASWVSYLLQPLLGSGLALFFYLGVRGGLFTEAKGADVNPYGVTALAGLSGLFSKQAINKLYEVSDAVFKTEKGKELRDKLDSQARTG